MYHASIDIEALGPNSGAVVLSLGAVSFDPHGNYIGSQFPFHVNIDITNSLQLGMHVDGDTIYWWLDRDTRSRNALAKPEPVLAETALEDLHCWYKMHHCVAAWSHRFDMELLGAYSARLAIKLPWSHRQELCIRTRFEAAAKFGYMPEKVRDKDKHHPVYDATRQAKQIQIANSFILKGEQP